MANEHGSIKDMFPPSNNGLQEGTGTILGDNKVTYEFRTPKINNNQVLTVNNDVTFTLSAEGEVTSVSPA